MVPEVHWRATVALTNATGKRSFLFQSQISDEPPVSSPRSSRHRDFGVASLSSRSPVVRPSMRDGLDAAGRFAQLTDAILTDVRRRFFEDALQVLYAQAETRVLIFFLLKGCAEWQRIPAIPAIVDQCVNDAPRAGKPIAAAGKLAFCAVARRLPKRASLDKSRPMDVAQDSR